MSTTFNVYPKLSVMPTFSQIIDLSVVRLHEYLSSYKIHSRYSVEVTLRSQEPDIEQPTNIDASAYWSDDLYAWFYIPTVPGGTDAYFWDLKEEDRDEVVEECHVHEMPEARRDLILTCLENNYFWHFRSSAGQPAIMNIAYGFIAASVAEITEGFIYSGDCAWDYERFPAMAKEFYQWYFRPEFAIDHNHKAWAESCLKILAKESTVKWPNCTD